MKVSPSHARLSERAPTEPSPERGPEISCAPASGPCIRGFATICCISHYAEILSELIEALHDSRLYHKTRVIELAVLGAPEAQAAVDRLIRPFDRIRICHRSEHIGEYEFPALACMQDACADGDGHVFYLHTKGVSHGPLYQHARYWRDLMVHHVVDNHQQCLEALRDHDCAGTNWRGNHFSGNFWWARADYVRRLPSIRTLQRRPTFLSSDPVWNARLQCEFWLGMGRGRHRNFGPANLDLYGELRWGTSTSEVINRVLAALGGSSCLELIFVGGGQPDIAASVHHLVGPDASTTFRMGVDEFFASGAGESAYDVIFVDSDHAEDACLSAIEQATKRLSPQGAIVVHDTNPPTAWHQRPVDHFHHGEAWNGEAWRAVVRFRASHPDVDVLTVDTDWGCTVILPFSYARRTLPPELGELTWERFERNRAEWLNLMSVRRFRRELFHWPYLLGQARPTLRTEVINLLISRFGFERYLEIGVDDPSCNFDNILAPVRHGVDPVRPTTFRMSSDEFFASHLGCDRYDVIFIDGLHEEEQCLRDIENALDRLAPNGFVVVHDTNPPTEWHQRPIEEFEPGSEWSGTVWKAIVRLRSRRPGCSFCTVDIDWGCTVIRPTGGEALGQPAALADLTWSAFQRDRRQWLNLITVDQYCRRIFAPEAHGE